MLWRRTPRLVVPDAFNRNSATVTAFMPAEKSGQWLLERMRQRLGFARYADQSLLDFGCGVRFSQTILNLRLPIGEYAGVDCFPEMIDFLRRSVQDQRFSYHLLDVRHPLYNPAAPAVLDEETRLPLPEAHFSIVSMFSVLTHQDPADARHILAMLRRHVRADGHLFFTCFLDPAIDAFEDRSPAGNRGRCVYNPRFLAELVAGAGWDVASTAPAEPPLIGDSYVCRPARAARSAP